MLSHEDERRQSGGGRKFYLRSVSWTDRSPNNPNPSHNHRAQQNSKFRSCLPPLQPLSVSRRNVVEWPRAGSDDLGLWPLPTTPGARIGSLNLNESSDVKEFKCEKDKFAFFDKECSRIVDHVYLGSEAVAKDREILRRNGITHVLNCVGFVCPEFFKDDLIYKTLWLKDSPSEDITSILYDVFDYFEDVREQNGRVLVHCSQGVSRSNSLVIAYLMWREGKSFHDAFQYVKAARGITNPNMGFACQLLQCQKRVHAMPASPDSMLRMYRIAPHSSYAPLHLVPKRVDRPRGESLDSRGAFVVHVPSVMYVWSGKNCDPVMVKAAMDAATQFIKYERAHGPVVKIQEGEESCEFWGNLGGDSRSRIRIRKIDNYDLDFEIFQKALAGGIVPLLPVSGSGSETCLPARGNGWARLRSKLANGSMKELLSIKSQSNHGSDTTTKLLDSSFLTSTPSDSPDSQKDRSKSPSLSPATSDYSSSLPSLSPSSSENSSSPSSSNWSDSTNLSLQASPSGFDLSMELCAVKAAKTMPSIAERRGGNRPSLMLASVAEVPQKGMVRSWSFSVDELRKSRDVDAKCGLGDEKMDDECNSRSILSKSSPDFGAF